MTTKLSQFEQLAKDMVLGNSVVHMQLLLDTYNLNGYFELYVAEQFEHDRRVRTKKPKHAYHNPVHTSLVMLNTAEGCWHGGFDYDTTRIALVAAMFHDCCHSYGRETYDFYNISAATMALALTGEKKFEGRLSESDLAKAHSIILGTEFPQCTSSYIMKEVQPLIEVVRAADIMTAYYSKDPLGTGEGRFALFIGLKEEMGVESMKEFIERQNQFMLQANVVFSKLRWSRIKSISQNFPKHFREVMKELEIYDYLVKNTSSAVKKDLIDDLSYAYEAILDYKEGHTSAFS